MSCYPAFKRSKRQGTYISGVLLRMLDKLSNPTSNQADRVFFLPSTLRLWNLYLKRKKEREKDS